MRPSLIGLALLATGCGIVGYDDQAQEMSDAQVAAEDLCTRADTILCDSFDSQIDNRYVLNEVNAGEVQVDPDFSYRGTGALRSVSPNSQGNGAQLWYSLPEVISSGVLHMSARIYVSAGDELQSWAIFLLAQAPDDRKVSLDGENGDILQLDSPVETVKADSGSLRRGEWTCAELSIDFDARTVSASQGELRMDSAIDDSFSARAVHIGLWAADNQMTVWLDDLYIGRRATGCAR